MFYVLLHIIFYSILFIGSRIIVRYQIKNFSTVYSLKHYVDELSSSIYSLFMSLLIFESIFILIFCSTKSSIFSGLDIFKLIVFCPILQLGLCRLFVTHKNLLGYWFLDWYILYGVQKLFLVKMNYKPKFKILMNADDNFMIDEICVLDSHDKFIIFDQFTKNPEDGYINIYNSVHSFNQYKKAIDESAKKNTILDIL